MANNIVRFLFGGGGASPLPASGLCLSPGPQPRLPWQFGCEGSDTWCGGGGGGVLKGGACVYLAAGGGYQGPPARQRPMCVCEGQTPNTAHPDSLPMDIFARGGGLMPTPPTGGELHGRLAPPAWHGQRAAGTLGPGALARVPPADWCHLPLAGLGRGDKRLPGLGGPLRRARGSAVPPFQGSLPDPPLLHLGAHLLALLGSAKGHCWGKLAAGQSPGPPPHPLSLLGPSLRGPPHPGAPQKGAKGPVLLAPRAPSAWGRRMGGRRGGGHGDGAAGLQHGPPPARCCRREQLGGISP